MIIRRVPSRRQGRDSARRRSMAECRDRARASGRRVSRRMARRALDLRAAGGARRPHPRRRDPGIARDGGLARPPGLQCSDPRMFGCCARARILRLHARSAPPPASTALCRWRTAPCARWRPGRSRPTPPSPPATVLLAGLIPGQGFFGWRELAVRRSPPNRVKGTGGLCAIRRPPAGRGPRGGGRMTGCQVLAAVFSTSLNGMNYYSNTGCSGG